MKKTMINVALAAALLSMAAAQAGEFSGSWVGAKLGSNRADVTGTPTVSAKSATTYGLEGGHNWEVNKFLLGVDGFFDWNGKADHSTPVVNYGSEVYGLDAKLGLPNGKWLPYAKLGYAHARANGGLVGNGNGAHYGLGVEYKVTSQWSLAGEYTAHSAKTGTNKQNNDNFTVGVNYYFSAPKAAAPVAPVAVAAPVVKKEEPKVMPAPVAAPAPAPAPKETWKTVVSEKPITIEGTSFDTNSAKLKPAADAKLNEVLEFAGKYRDADLVVTGYTDSRGSDRYNQALSLKRADSVKAALVKKGVAAGRIVTNGEGEASPIGDNKTVAGRAMNRRVEIRSVIREESKVRVVE